MVEEIGRGVLIGIGFMGASMVLTGVTVAISMIGSAHRIDRHARRLDQWAARHYWRWSERENPGLMRCLSMTMYGSNKWWLTSSLSACRTVSGVRDAIPLELCDLVMGYSSQSLSITVCRVTLSRAVANFAYLDFLPAGCRPRWFRMARASVFSPRLGRRRVELAEFDCSSELHLRLMAFADPTDAVRLLAPAAQTALLACRIERNLLIYARGNQLVVYVQPHFSWKTFSWGNMLGQLDSEEEFEQLVALTVGLKRAMDDNAETEQRCT